MSRTRPAHPVGDWFGERFNVPAIRKFYDGQLHKRLPSHVGFWHAFGSLSLFLLANQIITGILLMVYYRPTEAGAFESVHYTVTQAHFGWLIRGLHAWGATLMIVCVLVHMLRTFFMGSFKKPRELTWVIGGLIFGCSVVFGFTGYLLPWNQLSYWATVVGTEISGAIPLVGEYLKTLLRGGSGVTGETLARFYVVHVVVLPWVLTLLVVVHLVLMRAQGLATLERSGTETDLQKGGGPPFFPHHVLKEAILLAFLVGGLISLVILFPPELGEKADPFNTPPGIKPEWYFLPTYQLLKYFPKALGIFVSILPPVLLILWPFLDRGPERHPRHRRISVGIGAAAILLAAFFGFLGHISERNVTMFGRDYHIDMYGVPHTSPPPNHPERTSAPAEEHPIEAAQDPNEKELK